MRTRLLNVVTKSLHSVCECLQRLERKVAGLSPDSLYAAAERAGKNRLHLQESLEYLLPITATSTYAEAADAVFDARRAFLASNAPSLYVSRLNNLLYMTMYAEDVDMFDRIPEEVFNQIVDLREELDGYRSTNAVVKVAA